MVFKFNEMDPGLDGLWLPYEWIFSYLLLNRSLKIGFFRFKKLVCWEGGWTNKMGSGNNIVRIEFSPLGLIDVNMIASLRHCLFMFTIYLCTNSHLYVTLSIL